MRPSVRILRYAGWSLGILFLVGVISILFGAPVPTGSSLTYNSVGSTSPLLIKNLPAALTLNLNSSSLTASGNGNKVFVAPNASINGPSVTYMTVSLANALDGGALEFLSANWSLNTVALSSAGFSPSSLSMSFSPYTGPPDPSLFQAVLRTVTYQNNKPNPTPGPRTIKVVITSGTITASATTTVNVQGSGGGKVPTNTNIGQVPTSTSTNAPSSMPNGSSALITVSVTAATTLAARTLSGFASGGVPTGTILLSISGDPAFSIGTLNAQGSVTYLFKPTGGPGPYTLVATYVPTGNFLGSSGSANVLVTGSSSGGKVATTTSINAPSSLSNGSSALITVSVTAATTLAARTLSGFASGGVPTGTILLSISGDPAFSIGTLNAQGSVTYLFKPTGGPGPYTLVATCVPTGNFLGSSGSANVLVTGSSSGGKVATTTSINAPSSLSNGSSALITVSVTAATTLAARTLSGFASGGVPTGTILLSISGDPAFSIGTLNAQGSVTYLFKPTGGPGPYTLVATCVPTGNFLGSSGSANVLVTGSSSGGKVATTTSINAPSSLSNGSSALITVSVTAATTLAARTLSGFASGGVPTGTILLSISGDPAFSIGTLNAQGSVTYLFKPTGGPGPYTLVATYVPTGTFLGSSGSANVLVTASSGGGKVTTTTSISAPPITLGSTALVTVSVMSSSSTALKSLGIASTSTASVPTGSVMLSVSNGPPLFIGSLNSQGSVTYSLPSLGGPGNYTLYATYIPTGNFLGSSAYGDLIVTSYFQPFVDNGYYVAHSTNANDMNDGSMANPWFSINRVNRAIQNGQVQPGQTIHFRRGDTFTGTLTFPSPWGGNQTGEISITDYSDTTTTSSPPPVLFTPTSASYAIAILGADSSPLNYFNISNLAIRAGNHSGVLVQNAGNVSVSNVTIVGSYDGTPANGSDGNGLVFLNTSPTTLMNLTVEDVTIYGFGILNTAGPLYGYGGNGHGILVSSKYSLPTSMWTGNYPHVPQTPPSGGYAYSSYGGYVNISIQQSAPGRTCDISYCTRPASRSLGPDPTSITTR